MKIALRNGVRFFVVLEHNLTEKQVPIREPDLLIVLTGGKVGCRRQDGVFVIPIGCLKD